MHFTKKWSLVFLLVLLLGMVSLLTACDGAKKPTVLQQHPATIERYDLDVVKTTGNHSYIPFNIYGDPANHVDEILGALQAFELANPRLEVTGWHIEKQQDAWGAAPYIYGLWIDHRPR